MPVVFCSLETKPIRGGGSVGCLWFLSRGSAGAKVYGMLVFVLVPGGCDGWCCWKDLMMIE